MRKHFLISIAVLSINILAFSQTVITVSCDDTWGPGRYNKVSYTIKAGNTADFARFTQDFPVGLDIEYDNPGSGDFDRVGNQLNIVWMKIPKNDILTFSYFIKPDKSMDGIFTLTGRFTTISDKDIRQAVNMNEKNISINGTNGFLPAQFKITAKPINVINPEIRTENQTGARNNDIVFRVQVSVSSKKISEGELIVKLGLAKDVGARIVQSGKMFKYQAGNYSSYDSANSLLKQIISKGYKDAFIVAYSGTEQIPVEKARNSLK
jgi:ABC-type transport system substrate-binding protein